jgi:hypothetical protein
METDARTATAVKKETTNAAEDMANGFKAIKAAVNVIASAKASAMVADAEKRVKESAARADAAEAKLTTVNAQHARSEPEADLHTKAAAETFGQTTAALDVLTDAAGHVLKALTTAMLAIEDRNEAEARAIAAETREKVASGEKQAAEAKAKMADKHKKAAEANTNAAVRDMRAAVSRADVAVREKDAAVREHNAAAATAATVSREKDMPVREMDAAMRGKEAAVTIAEAASKDNAATMARVGTFLAEAQRPSAAVTRSPLALPLPPGSPPPLISAASKGDRMSAWAGALASVPAGASAPGSATGGGSAPASGSGSKRRRTSRWDSAPGSATAGGSAKPGAKPGTEAGAFAPNAAGATKAPAACAVFFGQTEALD